MNKIDSLIQNLCPSGVVFRSLSEITLLRAGERITKSMMSDESIYPVYGGGVFKTGLYSEYNFENSITISRAGSAGSVSWQSGKFWATDVCFVSSQKFSDINIKFIYYAVKTRESDLKKKVYGGNLPKLEKKYLWDLALPVPPLEIQNEIVQILDNFTELTTELTTKLTTELTARKQQYEYYRNYLFTFDKNIATVSLGSVSEISRGVRVVKKQLNADGEYPVYQNSLAPMGYYDKYNCDANTTYIISAGAAGEIGFCDKNFWAADDCFVLSNLNGLINKFIYYFLMTKQDFIRSQVRRASIPRLSRSVIENLEIPLIPLDEQQRIVEILDKFDKLVNDISEGIPAEIAARQKQYEYYRDKLLTFKEVGNESI